MEDDQNEPEFDQIFNKFHVPLEFYVRESYEKVSKSSGELASDAIMSFWRYRDKNGDGDVWKALVRCARHLAISQIRKDEALKRGGVGFVSLDALRAAGFDPASGDTMFTGRISTPRRRKVSACGSNSPEISFSEGIDGNQVPEDSRALAAPRPIPGYADQEQIESLQYKIQLDLVDRTIAKARASGLLRRKDEAFIRVMRKSAPDDLTSRETWEEFSLTERRLFTPWYKLGDNMPDAFYTRVVGRPKERLQMKLHKTYVAMGFSER